MRSGIIIAASFAAGPEAIFVNSDFAGSVSESWPIKENCRELPNPPGKKIMDLIADFLIRIKNGYLARKKEVVVPYSKLNENLAKILVKEGYLENSQVPSSDIKSKKELVVTLKYEGKKPVLTDVVRLSKPGLRVYLKKAKIPLVLGGLGTMIISTPHGLMTGKEARAKGLGGEAVCKLW